MLVPLKLPPGVVSNGTPLDTKGRWRDANFVRWVEGVMQPVGGWTRASPTPLPGRICGMQPLRDNNTRLWLIVGTNEGVWVLRNGVWTDLTPAGFTPGPGGTTISNGYGTADYSDEEYGTPRANASTITLPADSWSFDLWGEFVVGCSIADGVARLWKPGDLNTLADTEFAAITNAPEQNRSLLVTNERHLMLLAAGGDPRKLQWSAREDYTDWTPTALNLAGDLTIETAGTLQLALKVASDIVVLSGSDAFRVRYVGQPYGYGQERIGVNCGVAGAKAGASTNDFAVWMGTNGFWLYNGRLQIIPCDVWDFVFRDLNAEQTDQITCNHNSRFREVWWFFPKGDATQNSHYVVWNYRENWWATGELARTHFQEQGMWAWPLAGGTDGHVYEHERPLDALGIQPRQAPYVESAPFNIGNGDRVMFVTQLIPDQDCQSVDALEYLFETRQTPSCPANEFGPYVPDADGYTDVRFTGRQVRWRITAADDVDWRVGTLRADVKAGGRR